MPAVPGFVDEDGTVGELTSTAGAVAEFGCAGHWWSVWRRVQETAMAPIGCRSDAKTLG